MTSRFIYKKKSIPKRWFFYNVDISTNLKILLTLDRKIGVVFFNKHKKMGHSLFRKMEPLITFCKSKSINFVIPFSMYWANKYRAFGVLLEEQDLVINNKKLIINLKKRFTIICKVHSQTEAIKKKDVADIIFISPVHLSNSHPDQLPLQNYIFLYLCHLLKRKKIYALGGMNEKNFKIKNSVSISGFGGISTFRN